MVTFDLRTKRSKTALVSMIFGILYSVYAVTYWFSDIAEPMDTPELIGANIARLLVLPHLLLALIGTLMNILGFFLNSKGFILTGAILYTVSLVVFPIYFMFVIIQMILSYIAYARMSKKEKLSIV